MLHLALGQLCFQSCAALAEPQLLDATVVAGSFHFDQTQVGELAQRGVQRLLADAERSAAAR